MRLQYRIGGREKLLAIGVYPETEIGEARRSRGEARELIAVGKDPSREKQREKMRSRLQAADTFKAICDEYCEKRRREGAKGWASATAIWSEYLLSLVCGSIAIRATSLGRTRLYQLIAAGRPETIKIGNRQAYPAPALRKLLEGDRWSVAPAP